MTQSTDTPRLLVPRAFPLTGDLGPGGLDVPRALVALRARPGLVALDSAGGEPARWSLLAFDPFDDFGASASSAPRTLEELEGRLGQIHLSDSSLTRADLWPFAGGFIGALAYELGPVGEALSLPAPASPAPPIVGGLYGDWILFEHGEEPRTTLFLSEGAGGAPILDRYASLVDDLRGTPLWTGSTPSQTFRSGSLRRTVSAEEHAGRVEAVRGRIADGEIYQANVAHRMTAETEAEDVELFLELRRVNAAPYMGFCRFLVGDSRLPGAILSASPELLLELGPGGDGGLMARTRPIKGTIGRGADSNQDEAKKRELLGSQKDLAELAMIVDLERNDLGRIAVPGGVEVAGFPTVETYASVHHLVADVAARVRPDVTPLGVVASLFPGGSITGAPKLRSMEIIAELEKEGRGFFTGSMGFVDVRGRALLNILIRTLIYRGRGPGASGGRSADVSFHVGGGITWNSDPAHEDDETLLKAEGLLRALGLATATPSPGPSPSNP